MPIKFAADSGMREVLLSQSSPHNRHHSKLNDIFGLLSLHAPYCNLVLYFVPCYGWLA